MSLVFPPRRMVRWPFSAFATVVCIVIPLFWPVLAVLLVAEAFCLALWLVTFIVANLVVGVVLLGQMILGGVAHRHHSA